MFSDPIQVDAAAWDGEDKKLDSGGGGAREQQEEEDDRKEEMGRPGSCLFIREG